LTNQVELFWEEHAMKICFPVEKDKGLSSPVYSHFGSAPIFMVVDIDTNSVITIDNRDQHHTHGACSPMKALADQKIDAIVVGGIGAGALAKLHRMGIPVHRSQAATIRDNLALFKSGALAELTLEQCCNGHGRDTECSHYLACYKKRTIPNEPAFWRSNAAS
jgi:predicted Fe-Mo cluster-binding NifX family protein